MKARLIIAEHSAQLVIDAENQFEKDLIATVGRATVAKHTVQVDTDGSRYTPQHAEISVTLVYAQPNHNQKPNPEEIHQHFQH